MEIRLMCESHAMSLQERRAMWLQLPLPALEWLLGRHDLKVSVDIQWQQRVGEGRGLYWLLGGSLHTGRTSCMQEGEEH